MKRTVAPILLACLGKFHPVGLNHMNDIRRLLDLGEVGRVCFHWGVGLPRGTPHALRTCRARSRHIQSVSCPWSATARQNFSVTSMNGFQPWRRIKSKVSRSSCFFSDDVRDFMMRQSLRHQLPVTLVRLDLPRTGQLQRPHVHRKQRHRLFQLRLHHRPTRFMLHCNLPRAIQISPCLS